MQVDVSEILEFADKVDKSGDQLAGQLVGAVTKAAAVGETVARAWAPVGATGNLRRSIETEVQGTGRTAAGVRAVIKAKVPYGWYVEAGTARQRPQPFMRRGRDAAEPVVVVELERAAAKVLP